MSSTNQSIREPRWSRSSARRLATYLSGCLLFSLGGYLFIYSDLGTDPLDVFSLGLLKHVPLTVGIAQAGIAAVCILIWSLWYRRRPVVLPFVTFLMCGSIIDVLRALQPARFLPLTHFAIMLLATMLCAYASSLIIMSGVGIRAMDLLAIAMVEKWGWQLWIAKMSLEGVLLLTGYLMGGPVGIGTVCFLVVVDTLIQPFMRVNTRVLRMRNLGMPALEKP
ncbi:hypothetical protein [Kitasatospora sp. MAP5-34]|uniref:YczE/YyaS/YitT family protein n=1 Tax=Kitasatospora sp. MAP5-34 TaxID=3035102 RepID=UPI002476CDBC|nr:hypothetical protein [Kitasatospora sp. MAP5-34]MDH6574604.1 putative membrane protein YczE [Kitasatospora sp. MAP5-34]